MPVAYGFKSTDPKDAVAISNVMGQADSVNEQQYDTLAQYRINDVQMKPESLSLGLPRRWMLTMNTTLMGFNLPNNQSLFFGNENEKGSVGDGYVTYPLSAQEYSQMLQGGLYDNPEDYVKRFRQNLVNQEFFRQTHVSLTTAELLDSRLTISTGDLQDRPIRRRQYFIGNDLNAYADFGPDKNYQSNLSNVFQQDLQSIIQNPVESKHTDFDKKVMQSPQSVPDLPDVAINSEVDMHIDKERLDKLRSLDQQTGPDDFASNASEVSQSSTAGFDPNLGKSSVHSLNDPMNTPTPAERNSVAEQHIENVADSNVSESPTSISDDSSTLNRFDDTPTSNDFGDTNDFDSTSNSVSDLSDHDSNASPSVNDSVLNMSEESSDSLDHTDDQVSSDSSNQFGDSQDVSNDQNDEPQSVASLDDLMSQLGGGEDDTQTQLRRKRRQHAYVDDFGEALQNSQVAQEQKLNKRRNLQRQQSEFDQQSGPDL